MCATVSNLYNVHNNNCRVHKIFLLENALKIKTTEFIPNFRIFFLLCWCTCLLYKVRQITILFLENALRKNYWIFSQISFFIWKYNPSA